MNRARLSSDSDSGPSAIYVATVPLFDESGDPLPAPKQVMVTVWPSGAAEVAFRNGDSDTWGPPFSLTSQPTE